MDAEIAIYRKMLEGEGDGPGLRQLVEQVVRTTGINEVADTGEVHNHINYVVNKDIKLPYFQKIFFQDNIIWYQFQRQWEW